jgi:hypothetical protein
MIQALGGQAYLTVRNSESEGRIARFRNGTSEESNVFHRFWQWPDKERLEFNKQRDVAQLVVGDKLYEITSRGSRVVDSQKDHEAQIYLELRRHSLEIVLRQWLNEPGTALFDEGPSIAENHEVKEVRIVNSRNDIVILSIDKETHLPVRKTFFVRDQHGNRDKIAEVYDNWKTIQGINTPRNTLVIMNGDLQRQYLFLSTSYDHHLQSSIFEPGNTSDTRNK